MSLSKDDYFFWRPPVCHCNAKSAKENEERKSFLEETSVHGLKYLRKGGRYLKELNHLTTKSFE